MAHLVFDGDDRQALPTRRAAPPRTRSPLGGGFDADMDLQAIAARIDALKQLLGAPEDREPVARRRAA